jgi:hypothetical protein
MAPPGPDCTYSRIGYVPVLPVACIRARLRKTRVYKYPKGAKKEKRKEKKIPSTLPKYVGEELALLDWF